MHTVVLYIFVVVILYVLVDSCDSFTHINISGMHCVYSMLFVSGRSDIRGAISIRLTKQLLNSYHYIWTHIDSLQLSVHLDFSDKIFHVKCPHVCYNVIIATATKIIES